MTEGLEGGRWMNECIMGGMNEWMDGHDPRSTSEQGWHAVLYTEPSSFFSQLTIILILYLCNIGHHGVRNV